MLKLQKLLFSAALVLLSSTVLSAESTTAKEVPVMAKQVSAELSIFSGLPDPQWLLSSTEAQQFYAILSSLQRLEQTPPVTPSLGFRGVIIRNEADSSYVLYKGYVWCLTAGTTTVQQDTDQTLRAWLLKTSEVHLPADLYELLAKESEPRQLF